LAEINAQYEQIEKENKSAEIFSRPLPKFFITKKIELKRRRELLYEATKAKQEQLEELSKERDKYQRDLETERAVIQSLEKQLCVKKTKYLEELSQYEKAIAEYEVAQATYQEKKEFFETDGVALSIKAKTDSIQAQIAELEQEIKRLDKQSTPFTCNALNGAEYYLEKAAHREKEKRLTLEKIKIAGDINDLKIKLIAHKSQPLFDNE
jgi:hypothetical protein